MLSRIVFIISWPSLSNTPLHVLLINIFCLDSNLIYLYNSSTYGFIKETTGLTIVLTFYPGNWFGSVFTNPFSGYYLIYSLIYLICFIISPYPDYCLIYFLTQLYILFAYLFCFADLLSSTPGLRSWFSIV